jgi:protein-disulfide isomerase
MLIEKRMSEKDDGGNIQLSSPVSESRDHIQGPTTAAVTLVEYGDYECPYCAQAYLIVKEVQERLGNKLRFVFRNYPLSKLRLHSYQSALAVETAAAQGKFWEMYDFLFKHGQSLTDDNLIQSAAKLGLQINKFDIEFRSRTYSRHVDEDIQSGDESGVTKTPTFFINGDRYNDSWDLDSLLSALDEASVFNWREQTNNSE